MPTLSVLRVPTFQDNYLWLIHDDAHAVAVDPGDAAPIIAALEAHKLSLTAILLTHHHADHVGGVKDLLNYATCPVYGPSTESIRGVSDPLSGGNRVSLTHPQLDFDVLDVPGHTAGHIAYVERKHDWLFCGDTLFAGGCGRLFEGTPAQMLASLDKLAALPPATKVYCAHEYTLSNLKFACAAEPDNAALLARFAEVQSMRERGVATVPSDLATELATNPFLRCDQPTIRARVQAHTSSVAHDKKEVFAQLRQWKNDYR